MKTNLEKLEKCQTKLSVVVEPEEWKNAQQKEFKKLADQTTVPGFRKGHAPENLVKTKVNHAEVLRRAADAMIDVAYKNAIKEHQLKPYYQPELNIVKMDDDQFEFDITFIGAPTVKLGGYKDIEVKKDKVSVSDEDVQTKIDDLIQKNAELEIVEDGILESGNTAVIDFEGFIDGVPFEGGKAENFSLEIGSNTFVPGFEEQLIGMKSNEESDIKITFPQNYVENLSGKEATFKVKLHEIKRKVLPTLNDEFVKEVDIKDVNTVDELKEHFKKEIQERKENEASEKQLQELIQLISEKAEFEVSDKMIEEEAGYMIDNFKARVEQNGLKYEDYLKMTNTDEAKLLQQAKDEAMKSLKQLFVLNEIGLVENITVSDEEVDEELKKMADLYHMNLDELKKNIKDRIGQFKNDLRNNKIVKFLKENNKLS